MRRRLRAAFFLFSSLLAIRDEPALALEIGGLASATNPLAGGGFAESWRGELYALEILGIDRPVTSADVEYAFPILGPWVPLLIAGIHDDPAEPVISGSSETAALRSLHAGLGLSWEETGLRLTVKSVYLRNTNDLVTRRNEEGWLGRAEVALRSAVVAVDGTQLWGPLSASRNRVGAEIDLDFGRDGGHEKLGYLNARFQYAWEDPLRLKTTEASVRGVAWGLAVSGNVRNNLAQGTEWTEVAAVWDWWEGPSPPFRPPTLAEYFTRLSRTTAPSRPIFLLTDEEIEERPYDADRVRYVTFGARYRKDFPVREEELSFSGSVHVPWASRPFLELTVEYSEEVRAESPIEGVKKGYAGSAGVVLPGPPGAVLFAQFLTRGRNETLLAGEEDVWLLGLCVSVRP